MTLEAQVWSLFQESQPQLWLTLVVGYLVLRRWIRSWQLLILSGRILNKHYVVLVTPNFESIGELADFLSDYKPASLSKR